MSNLGVEVSINDIGKIPHWKCHSYWAIDPRLKENDMVLDYISNIYIIAFRQIYTKTSSIKYIFSIENRMIEYDKDKNGTISFPEVNIDILMGSIQSGKNYDHFHLHMIEISIFFFKLIISFS